MNLQPFAKGTILYQLIQNMALVIREVTSPAKFGLDPMSGRAAT